MTSPAIGFIGFGEAAFWIARGLRQQGLRAMVAYDIHTGTAGRGELIRQRAEEAQVQLLSAAAAVPERCDLVISAVPADAAEAACQSAVESLAPRHFYVDINSVSPAVKQKVGAAVAARNALFVEAAVMSTVPPLGHRVPMFLCGPGAAAFVDLMRPLEMQLEVVEGPIGSAAAIKMFRSIIIKGLEALMLECVLGAETYGAAAKVFATVSASIPGINWDELAHYMIGRTALHAERRVHEMEESARTLTDAGVDPIMTSAIVRRIQTCADLNLSAKFNGREPASYREIVRAFRSGGAR
jgi:3-hydroxyisobutyrate dehydrogenase-like beta-hydroxyacid dehydrogenase